MSSGQEKKLILNHINKMIASTKWTVKYGYMTLLHEIPTRIYEVYFNDIKITVTTADDIVDEEYLSANITKIGLYDRLWKNNLIKTTCRLKRKRCD